MNVRCFDLLTIRTGNAYGLNDSKRLIVTTYTVVTCLNRTHDNTRTGVVVASANRIRATSSRGMERVEHTGRLVPGHGQTLRSRTGVWNASSSSSTVHEAGPVRVPVGTAVSRQRPNKPKRRLRTARRGSAAIVVQSRSPPSGAIVVGRRVVRRPPGPPVSEAY